MPHEVRKLLRTRFVEGDDRRRNLVALGAGPGASQLDALESLKGIAFDHWSDLRAGAAFMDLRNAALAVLDRLEQRLLQLRDANEPVRLSANEASERAVEQLDTLRQCASQQGDKIDAEAEATSRNFLSEIRAMPEPQLLQKLAERDGPVIHWRGNSLSLGPGFCADPGWRPGGMLVGGVISRAYRIDGFPEEGDQARRVVGNGRPQGKSGHGRCASTWAATFFIRVGKARSSKFGPWAQTPSTASATPPVSTSNSR